MGIDLVERILEWLGSEWAALFGLAIFLAFIAFIYYVETKKECRTCRAQGKPQKMNKEAGKYNRLFA